MRSRATKRRRRRGPPRVEPRFPDRERAMLKPIAATLLICSLTASCTVGPDYKRPQVDVPAAWPVSAPEANVSARWWTLYADAELNLLVEEALGHNTSLRVAAARVDEARAGLTV